MKTYGTAALEPFVDDVWIATRPQKFYGFEVGTRMTVVRLSDGGLFVHCPVALDDATRSALRKLGPVRAVAASSLFHHLYVGQWMEAYPDARFCPCPGLERKRSDLAWGPILGDTPLDAYSADIDQALFTARFEKEVVFFHRASRTLICADALLNLTHHPLRSTRIGGYLMGNTAPGKGYLERIAVRDRALGRRQVDQILQWDIDAIVLAHGGLVPNGGREALREAYRWL
ncbi:MAG TPA: DUF4336 domain-containing protein [Polyangiaceae bacterium]|nr:DUF4336 domain-containing protein [Polyangiaceae bacterium]